MAVSFFYLFIARLFGNEAIAELGHNKIVNVITCLAFVAIATYIAYRGITATIHVQVVLVGFQMIVLVLFVIMAFVAAPSSPGFTPFSLDWLNPFTGLELSAFVAGLTGSIFAFWGWDVCLTVNEESKDADRTPGRAALISVVSILVTYLLVAIAAIVYAGVGAEGLGLANEETSDNVFAALAEPVMGSWLSLLLFLAVLASSAASLQTTFIPASRTLLAMGSYRAIPPRFAHIHSRFHTPSFATIAAAVGTAVFYTVLTFLSESVAQRHHCQPGHHDLLLLRAHRVRVRLVLPARAVHQREQRRVQAGLPAGRRPDACVGLLHLGARQLRPVLRQWSPDRRRRTRVHPGGGHPGPGAVLMLIWRVIDPGFFRGETLKHDTPSLIVED